MAKTKLQAIGLRMEYYRLYMATAPIMVVGGSGFLGSHVCRELAEKKFEFICFDIQSPECEGPRRRI